MERIGPRKFRGLFDNTAQLKREVLLKILFSHFELVLLTIETVISLSHHSKQDYNSRNDKNPL